MTDDLTPSPEVRGGWPPAGPRRPDGALAVWAPRATSVAADLERRRLPMVARDAGWFVTAEGVPPGTDYRFVLDGHDAFADPRSAWQPRGVQGPSRTLDHTTFVWTDQRWRGTELRGGLVYELHVGTFDPTGTFDGVVDRLDHLVELGVTLIELMPVAEFPGRRGWGYDGVLLFAPHHAYGGPHGLKRLVDAAHERGVGVLLDVVYNHLGPEGNHMSRFGPYFSDVHHTPWGAAVNLDGPGSMEVRRFLCDNACQWLRDYHLDGLRLDAVHALVDSSAITFLEELSTEVERLAAHLGRRLHLVAESDANDPSLSTPRDAGGIGLDAQWNDDFHHAVHTTLTQERSGYYVDFRGIPDLAVTYREAFVRAGQRSRHTDARRGRPVGHHDGNRFVAFTQNHDQIGNRAAGDRLSHLVGLPGAMTAAALLMFSPFVPLLFQGEEWGATSPFCYFAEFDDAALAEAVRQGRRKEFAGAGWGDLVPDPIDPATFDACRLAWEELDDADHRRLFDWHRALVQLRRRWPELTDGRLDLVRTTVVGNVLTVQRGRLLLLAATAVGPFDVAVPGRHQLLLSSDGLRRLDADRLQGSGPWAAILVATDDATSP